MHAALCGFSWTEISNSESLIWNLLTFNTSSVIFSQKLVWFLWSHYTHNYTALFENKKTKLLIIFCTCYLYSSQYLFAQIMDHVKITTIWFNRLLSISIFQNTVLQWHVKIIFQSILIKVLYQKSIYWSTYLEDNIL